MQVAPAVQAGEGDREHGLVPHKFRVTWMRVGDEQGGPQEELTSVRAPVVCSSAGVASILMCGDPFCSSVLLLVGNHADRGPGQLQVYLPGSLQPLCACVCSVQRVPGLLALLCVDCGCRGSLHMDEVSTQHLAGGGQPEAAADAKFTATLCCRVAREVKRQAERQAAGEEGRHGEGQDEEVRARQEREEGRAVRRQAILRRSRQVAQGMGQPGRLDAQPQGQRMRNGRHVAEEFGARILPLYQSLEATAEADSRPAVEDVEKCFQVS